MRGRLVAQERDFSNGGRRLRTAGNAPRRLPSRVWLHGALLAVAPVLAASFYGVVHGAVERGAARHAAPAATSTRLQPTAARECAAAPAAETRARCRASMTANDEAASTRASISGG